MSDYILLLCADPGVPWLGPSGASAHLRGVCEGFLRLGLDVRVATLRREDHRQRVRSAPSVPTLHCPPPRWPHQLREHFETWWARALVRQATRTWGVPSMIYERFSLFSDAGLRLQRSRQIPRILEINAPLLRERQSVRNPRRAAGIQSEVMQGATRVLVVSRWLKRWAVDEIGCAPQGVRHIPNGVRSPSSGEATDLKESFGNPEILLGFLGSMREWHGLGALPDLLEALPEAAAVLIGDGPVTISHPRLHSLGFIDPDELSATLRALDVGIAPYSRTAPPWLCPLKLLEYRAHGLPIVTTDVADAKLIISENDLAMTTLDPSAWAAAIRAQARRAPEPKLRLWSEVCAEAIEGILLNLRPPPSQG